MKAPLHKCACSTCSRQVPTYLLMCINHWRMVPAPLARAVRVAWSARNDNPGSLEAARAHQLAVQQAVTAVADKLAKRATGMAAAGVGDLFNN